MSSFMMENHVDFIHSIPPGVKELILAVLSQVSLVAVAATISYITAPSKRHREVLWLTIPVTIQNYFAGVGAHAIVLLFMSWIRGLPPLHYSFSDFNNDNYNFKRTIRELLTTIGFFEIMFYLGHRAMHHPKLYKYVHRVHHEFEQKYQEHVPLANFYSHPLEFLYVYSLIMFGTLIQRAHIINTVLSGGVAGIATMYLHSGFDIPGIMGHELHHQRPKFNFGALGVLDYIFGTLYAPMTTHTQPAEKRESTGKQLLQMAGKSFDYQVPAKTSD
ncbi:hypothetical protein F5X68DRAFT_216030 [Plectosphaerella plurivora]|uniref:Fatty acid hydroxylase domain-containing protein n=1 Tax=Plectosphaerella plurivora TaxID=936078 RepID=A0A9P9A768_9PEZI|nr:hypothetical protein F5X68DRAFT_216030 [Plectosphaerella plurivora]